MKIVWSHWNEHETYNLQSFIHASQKRLQWILTLSFFLSLSQCVSVGKRFIRKTAEELNCRYDDEFIQVITYAITAAAASVVAVGGVGVGFFSILALLLLFAFSFDALKRESVRYGLQIFQVICNEFPIKATNRLV